MKLRLSLIFTFALVGCRDLVLPDPPPTTAFVSGRVVAAVPGTAVSAPVAGASVSVLNTNISGTTDERGIFTLGPLPPGTFRIFFSSKTATSTRQRIADRVQVLPGATNSLGDVSLQENALLTGRALIQGRTVGNVGITVFSPGTDYVTTAADNGGWLLTNLPEGAIRATAWRPGFTPATTTDIQLQGGVVTSAVDLVLEPELVSAPPGSIVGRVVVLDREDNAGVTVKASSSQTHEVRTTAVSAADGTFTLPNLTSDLYIVTLELDGYPSARIPNLAVSGGVQLELDPVILALAGDGNTGANPLIGGPSGPLFSLDGGVTSGDGGTFVEDGGTIGAECALDSECASGRLCIGNRCVGCSVNVQCRPGYSCNAGDCVRDCQSNAECPSGLACISGSCVNCVTSSDCRDPGLVCNAQSRCAPCQDRTECPAGKACLVTGCGTCTLDVDCGPGALCEQGVCTAGDCHGNADCAPDQACVGRTCGACAVDSQCRGAQLCINAACVTGNCRSVLECQAGQVCLSNQCGACANDQQCGVGQLCLPGSSGLRCTPATCRVSGDCTGASAGLQCVNNQCLPCGSNTPCNNGQICNAQGRCVVGDCFTNLDCTGSRAGWACVSGNCRPCAAASECGASGFVCSGGQCLVGNCVTPTDCPIPGQLCTNNTCVGCNQTMQCGPGNVCGLDGLCHAGNCAAETDCSGRLCVGNVCTNCTNNTQCGTGRVCSAGACVVGNCASPADCATGQLCVNNSCSSCGTSTPCPVGQVCDTDALCYPGNCIDSSTCAGQVCVNHTCSSCTQDSQCGAGRLCLGGVCSPGNCRGNADCAATNQVCLGNTCSNCTQTSQCAAGQVCDTLIDNRCHPGNCVTNANCSGGQLCLNRSCAPCTLDSQCGGGQICFSGACVNGTCHNDGECSGGTQLCNPVSHVCQPCSPVNQLNNTACGGAGRVCDSAGFCRFGTCLTNTNCAAGQVCSNFNCASCTADAQCNAGQLCVNNACKTGNCHGTGADPNIDCAATNGVCVVTGASNVCTGNCRSNADCAATGYCDTGPAHQCVPCTGAGQCGQGKVCTPGGSGNTCVAAQCSLIEPNCAVGQSCVGGVCLQYGPSTAYDGGGYTEPGVFSSGFPFSPMVLSGRDTLYFSAYETGATPQNGTYSVALEPGSLAVRWRVLDSPLSGAKDRLGGAGIVLPAPGFPNDELFLANDGSGGAIAHRSDNGGTAWRITPSAQVFAAGLVNGVPHVAWVGTSGSAVSWMRTDGLAMKQVTIPGLSNFQGMAFGTKAIYVICIDALYVVDPITSTFRTVPHGGNGTLTLGNTPGAYAAVVWRPPNNYVARGFNSGTVTSDVLVYPGSTGPTRSIFAVNVPDDWVTNPSPTNTWTLWTNSTSSFSNGLPLTIDATGAIHSQSGATFYKVNVFNGQQLTTASLGPSGAALNLMANSQLIGVSGNALQGFVLADGATTASPSLWSLPPVPGNFLNLYVNPQTTTTSPDHLLVFQNDSSGRPVLRALAPGLSATTFTPSSPARTIAGDSANHLCAPGYDCTTNAQCPATQSCMLGKCAGQCRTASQCAAGQGCSLAQCGACLTQAACRGGEVCWAGQCLACSGAGCCNTSADCGGGGYCQTGTCRVLPQQGQPGAFSLPTLITRSNTRSSISVAPDGTMYVGDTNGSNQPFWKVVTDDGTIASTTLPIPLALGSNSQDPVLMIASNGSPGMTLWHGIGSRLYSAPASSSLSSLPYNSYATPTQFIRLAQGVSSVLGSPRPTLYATVAAGVGTSSLLAIDAAAASVIVGAADPGLLWTAPLGPTCNVGGLSNPFDNLLIGSDGTVYVVCNDYSVQAWAPDGDPTTGAAPGRLGLLKWRSAPPPGGWGTTSTMGHPAIGKAAGGDVMYVGRASGGTGLTVLNLATASNGTVPLELPVDGSGGILTDAAGRALVLGAQGLATDELAIVSPAGTVLFSDKTTWTSGGRGWVLTGDGTLLFPDLKSTGKRITAVTVSNPASPVELFSITGPANLEPDNNSGVVVLSTAQVDGGLIAFDHLPPSGVYHSFSGMPFANSPGPMPNAWSTRNADQQRRNSLKTE